MRSTYVPPHVPPADGRRGRWTTLRDAIDCPLRNWPRDLYEKSHHKLLSWPVPVHAVMAPAALEELFLTKADDFAQGPIFRRIVGPVWGGGLLTQDGEDWRWQRRAAAPAFKPSVTLQAVEPAGRLAAALADGWLAQGNEPCDILPGLADLASGVALAVLLDVDRHDDPAAFHDAAGQMSDVLATINPADLFRLPLWTRPLLGRTVHRPAAFMHDFVGRALARKAGTGAPGSLRALLAEAVDPETGMRMGLDLLRDNMVGALAAGRDTSGVSLAWAVHLISRHRPTYERVIAEIDTVTGGGAVRPEMLERLEVVRAAFLETLRLFPPGPQFLRDAVRDTSLGGHAIPAGAMVVVPVYAVHRHRARWDRPDVFDPDRFVGRRLNARELRYAYLPFGAGSRVCLGLSLALAEAVTALATLFQRLRFEPAIDDDEIGFAAGILRPKRGLPMRIRTRTGRATSPA